MRSVRPATAFWLAVVALAVHTSTGSASDLSRSTRLACSSQTRELGHQGSQDTASRQLQQLQFIASGARTRGACLPRSPADIAQAAEDDRLIGWQGEKRHTEGSREPWIETISWSPRAFIYHGFLSHEECDGLRAQAARRLSRSMVDDGTPEGKADPIRTSYSASLMFHESPLVRDIEQRIAAWTHLPESHGEPIEVLRYRNGQKYEAHWDWFGRDLGNGSDTSSGDRVATVLMYLSDVEDHAGGETSLPLATPVEGADEQDTSQLSPCAARMGLAVRPRKGDALLFWDALPDGETVDRKALHASCPTFRGDKWTATKWIHGRPYGNTG